MGLFHDKALEQIKIEELSEEIRRLSAEVKKLQGQRDAEAEGVKLNEKINKLRKELTDLQIEKDRVEEDNAREKREVTHMVGLERKRGEWEIEKASQEAVLRVREENLKHEREQFKKEMDTVITRFEKTEQYIKELMEKVLERLPTVTVDRTITERTGRGKAA